MSLITNYYSSLSSDSAQALRELKRLTQKGQALLKALEVKSECSKIKKTFNSDGEVITSNTKVAIQSIYGQVDTTIKGTAADALKETMDKVLPEYDTIFLS